MKRIRWIVSIFLALLVTLASCDAKNCLKKEEDNNKNKNDLDLYANLFTEGLALVQNENLQWGYMDEKGNLIIDYKFNSASIFRDGYAIVHMGYYAYEDYYFINKRGEIVSDEYYYLDYDDETGYYLFGDSNTQKFGVLDADRNVITDAKYDQIYCFSEGLAMVTIGKSYEWNCKYGYIDTKGNEVIKPQFIGAYSFSDGFAPVNSDGKWGYIDKTGKLVIDAKYKKNNEFSDGIALVETDEESAWHGNYNTYVAIINTKGEVLFKETENKYIVKCENGYYCFYDYDDKCYHIYNNKGKEIIKHNSNNDKVEINLVPSYLGYIYAYDSEVNELSWYTTEGELLFDTNDFATDIERFIHFSTDWASNELYFSVLTKNGEYQNYHWNGLIMEKLDLEGVIYKVYNGYIVLINLDHTYSLINKSQEKKLECDSFYTITGDGYIIYRIDGKYSIANLENEYLTNEKFKYIKINYSKMYLLLS